ncbi:MAG: glutamine-synthetase adenylyltransferase, partial [Pseudomonadota bacterium]
MTRTPWAGTPGGMDLGAPHTQCPKPFDDAKAAEIRAEFAGLPDPFRALLAGAGASSPYLSGLIARHAAWVRTLPGQPAEAVLQALFDAVAAPRADLGAHLRGLKGQVALLTALADLGGHWPLETVTAALTGFADKALDAAMAAALAKAVARGRLADDGAPYGGLFALAMGKMGALELNYSSDIDLIFLFDESLYPAARYAETRSAMVDVAKDVVRCLSAVTDAGYVFRVDLRLRPDPATTPIVIGAAAAERYYEAQGRLWERAAMIKARPAAGDVAAGARFLASLSPFVWRRSLDFAAIEDIRVLRQKTLAVRGLGGAQRVPGANLKLGRGGIREIEFLAQTLQLIYGGRDPGLRARGTRPALAALAARGLVTPDDANTLDAAYVAHRTLEHRLQMIEDAQTHTYPVAEAARARVVHLSGGGDVAAFEAALGARFAAVEARAQAIFPVEKETRPAAWSAFPDAQAAASRAAAWKGRPALRSDRASRLFQRLEPQIAERLSGAHAPEEALAAFDTFLSGLPAGVQVFSLFDANPPLLDLLVDICARAPRLARYLGRHPGVLDAVLSPQFFAPLGSRQALAAALNADLAGISDFERVLDRVRVWVHERQFQIGVQLLQGLATPDEAGGVYSDIAE